MLFTGEYEHAVDAKHRLAIPAEIRSRLDGGQDGAALYLAPGPNGHLWLWPEETFQQMAAAMEQSLLPGEPLMEFEVFLFSQASRMELDAAGRVRLPERLYTETGLGQQVIILGVKDHLELRDPAQWAKQRAQSRARQREIMLDARQAMRDASQRNSPRDSS